MKTYQSPQVSDLGSISDLTLMDNKRGAHPDVYSSVVPIVGSIGPVS